MLKATEHKTIETLFIVCTVWATPFPRYNDDLTGQTQNCLLSAEAPSEHVAVYSCMNTVTDVFCHLTASSLMDDVTTRGGAPAWPCWATGSEQRLSICTSDVMKCVQCSISRFTCISMNLLCHTVWWNVLLLSDQQYLLWVCAHVMGVCCVKSYSGGWPCCNHDRELLNQSDSVTGLFITSGFTDCSCLMEYWLPGLCAIQNWIKKAFVIHFQMLSRTQNCNSNLNLKD